jgi:large subunit ribosomal protein L25
LAPPPFLRNRAPFASLTQAAISRLHSPCILAEVWQNGLIRARAVGRSIALVVASEGAALCGKPQRVWQQQHFEGVMAEVFNVQSRDSRGKRNARRLRQAGRIPAVLYGHGETPQSLSLAIDEVSLVLRHGHRLVQLQGDITEQAFIRDLQWDTYGTEVLHLDLSRVSATDRVRVAVPVELKGEAIGIKEGGLLQHLLHELHIECLATAMPEKLQLNVSSLGVGSSLFASNVDLPAGVNLVSDPHTIVVACVRPTVEGEAVPGAGEGAEPEVIGRKAEKEDEE